MSSTPNPIEQYAQVLLATARPALASTPAEHRDAALEGMITGYVRLALEFQTPAKVRAVLKDLADSLATD